MALLTQIKNGPELRQNTYATAATGWAFGLGHLKKNCFFIEQSDVPQVTETSLVFELVFFTYQR